MFTQENNGEDSRPLTGYSVLNEPKGRKKGSVRFLLEGAAFPSLFQSLKTSRQEGKKDIFLSTKRERERELSAHFSNHDNDVQFATLPKLIPSPHITT